MRTHRNYVELGGEDNPWEADINPLLPNNPTVICIAPQFQKKSPSGSQWSSQMLLVGRALEERARSPSLHTLLSIAIVWPEASSKPLLSLGSHLSTMESA